MQGERGTLMLLQSKASPPKADDFGSVGGKVLLPRVLIVSADHVRMHRHQSVGRNVLYRKDPCKMPVHMGVALPLQAMSDRLGKQIVACFTSQWMWNTLMVVCQR